MKAHPTIISAAALLKRKWPTCRNWSKDEIINYLAFFNEQRQLGVVQDEGKCVGVGLVRFLTDKEQASEIGFNDPSGTIAWVEMVVGSKPFAVQTLMLGLVDCCKKKAPNVSQIGGRHVVTGAHRLYPFDRYLKLLMNRRISYGW